MGLDDIVREDEESSTGGLFDGDEREYIQDIPKCPRCGLMGVNNEGLGYKCDNQNCEREYY